MLPPSPARRRGEPASHYFRLCGRPRIFSLPVVAQGDASQVLGWLQHAIGQGPGSSTMRAGLSSGCFRRAMTLRPIRNGASTPGAVEANAGPLPRSPILACQLGSQNQLLELICRGRPIPAEPAAALRSGLSPPRDCRRRLLARSSLRSRE